MAITFGSRGWRAFSKAKESTFDSAATINNIEGHIGSEPFNHVPDLTPDVDEVKGYEEATKQQDIAFNSTAEHRQRMTPNGLAQFLAFGLGNVSTVANEPAATWYTHTFSPVPTTFASGASLLDSASITVDDQVSFPSSGTLKFLSDGVTVAYSAKVSTNVFTVTPSHRATVDNEAIALVDTLVPFEMPSMSVVEYYGIASPQYLYTGVVVPKVGISVSRKQPAILEASMLGSGTRATSADARPAFSGESFLKAGDLAIATGGTWNGKTWGGATTTISAIVQSIIWEYMNQFEADDGFGMGGGKVRTRAVREGREQTLRPVLELTASTYLDLLTSQSTLTARLLFTGSDNYKATFVFPELRMRAVPLSGGRGRIIQNAEFQVAQEDNTCSVQVEVINKITGYHH